jgi:DNA-binding transcriptional MerR regulator
MEPENEIPSTKKYFKIGEVSKMLEVPATTLRFWEKEFKQLKPMKNKKGDRIYHLKDLEVLREIKYLTHDKGIRIANASKKVKRTETHTDDKTELLRRLRELRETLLEFKTSLD